MPKIPRSAYSAGIRVFVGLWLLFGILYIWNRIEGMRRPVSRIATTRSQVASLAQAIETYSLDNGVPPTTAQGLEVLLRPPTTPPLATHWEGPYLADARTLPVDEWGRPYLYQSPGPGGEPFLISSYGKDGKTGGDGEDADISRSPSDAE